MDSSALLSLTLLTVASLLGSGSSLAVDVAAATTAASTTPTSTTTPGRGFSIGRWRLSQGGGAGKPPADEKVEPRVLPTAPLPEAGLGVSALGDALTGSKLAMAQKLLEHPLIAKIIRPIVDFVSGTGSGVDGAGELLNPSFFGSSFSFPFAFRSNFKSANGSAEGADSSNKEDTIDDSGVRNARAVRSGSKAQHYRLNVARHGQPGPPMLAP